MAKANTDRSLRRRILAALLPCFVCGFLAATPARAVEEHSYVDAATKTALQRVISDQLAAIEKGDGAAAEAFATPAIHDKFPEPERFLSMVKQNYAALVHPKSTQFTDIVPSPHGPLQKMTIVAADGTVWTAIYSFEQIGGDWRISGCGLQQDKSQQDI